MLKCNYMKLFVMFIYYSYYLNFLDPLLDPEIQVYAKKKCWEGSSFKCLTVPQEICLSPI